MKMNLTNEAKIQLQEMNKGDSTFRIKVVNFSPCSGPTFTIVPDNKTEKDLEFNVQDYDFIIDEQLYDSYKRFSVDYTPSGLRRGFDVKGYPEYPLDEEEE